jgi:hypothetical protein
MLVVMNPHRLFVDVRLERVVVVRQRRNFVGHAGFSFKELVSPVLQRGAREGA